MFVKIEDMWLNTDQIVSLKPHGKSFRVNLSDGEFLALRLPEYLVLVKAMKIKQMKPVRKKPIKKSLYNRVLTGERVEEFMVPKMKNFSPDYKESATKKKA